MGGSVGGLSRMGNSRQSHHGAGLVRAAAQTRSALPDGFPWGSGAWPWTLPCCTGGGRSGCEAAGGPPDEGWEYGAAALGFRQGNHLARRSEAAVWSILALEACPGGVLSRMLRNRPISLHTPSVSRARTHTRGCCALDGMYRVQHAPPGIVAKGVGKSCLGKPALRVRLLCQVQSLHEDSSCVQCSIGKTHTC